MASFPQWYLGANTPNGFYSLFDELYFPGDDARLYILKGGPGSGKSTLMKKAARQAQALGLSCELVYCSSDPDSLDAVLLPELHAAIADGTAPHVLEPRYPGVCETLWDLGQCRDDGRLRENAREIRRLTDENKRAHARTAAFLRAAQGAAEEMRRMLYPAFDERAALAAAKKLWEKEGKAFPGREATCRRRFLSAVTPKGVRLFGETAGLLAERVYVLADESGLAASAILRRLEQLALADGADVIVCPCPMAPEEKTDHLIVPALSLAFVTENRFHTYEGARVKSMRCRRFFDADFLKAHRHRLAFYQKAAGEMVCEAVSLQTKAKALHDELEAYYIAATDRAALDECAARLLETVFGDSKMPAEGSAPRA